MNEYVLPTDKLLLGGHLALGTSISIETASGEHGIDFPDEITFDKTSIHKNGIRSDTYGRQEGELWAIAGANKVEILNNLDLGGNNLTNIGDISITTSQVASTNYSGQNLEHELDALTTSQNTILARTQGLNTNKIMKSNGSGILAVSSLTEADIHTLAGNQTVSGNKTHSGDITINDLTASKLVLTDANKKLVSASVTETDLFRLGVTSNQFVGADTATVFAMTQSSNESYATTFLRMSCGSSSATEMGLQITNNTQSINFTDSINLLNLNGNAIIGQVKNTGINIVSGKTYQINGSQIASANLSDTANIVKLDTSENNFTGVVDASSFKQGNSALNFSHLAGSASTSQIPSLPSSQLTSGTLAVARIPTLPATQITSGTIADARLPTNILRDDDDDQTISSSQSTGTNLRIRHSSNFSTGDPAIILEDYTQLANNLHSGIITLDNLSDVAIKTSKNTGGVVFYNNTNTFLGRLDNGGMNIKSGLSYKVDGVALNSLTTGTQTIAGVKTFSSKPVFSAGFTSSASSSLTATAVVGNLTQSGGVSDFTGNMNIDGNLNVEDGHTAVLPPTTIRGTLNQINGMYSTNGKISSTYNGSFQAVDLRNGQGASGGTNEGQISFSYNGTTTYSHIIKSTHSSSNIAQSALDFHINDTTSASNLLSGTTLALRVRGDAIETKKPIINGCTEVAQYPRFLISMNLGEAFIDLTRPIKMKCNLYRLADLDSNADRYLRVHQTATGEGNQIVFGLGQSGNLPYSANPNPIIVYDSTSENSNTHSNTSIFTLDYASDTAFGVTGGDSMLVCEGYLYKKATSTNNFNTATKNATRSFWSLRVRNPDDLRITINKELIFLQNAQGTSIYQAIFTMNGDFAHIKAECFNKADTANISLIFSCLGTSS